MWKSPSVSSQYIVFLFPVMNEFYSCLNEEFFFGCFCQTGKKSNTKSIDNVLILYIQKALLLWGQF